MWRKILGSTSRAKDDQSWAVQANDKRIKMMDVALARAAAEVAVGADTASASVVAQKVITESCWIHHKSAPS
ncbi:MAG TPA: hypothetical protein ENK23_07515 [Sorangium sp.]|nr:hypothetical protein [Sorangium sp.]